MKLKSASRAKNTLVLAKRVIPLPIKRPCRIWLNQIQLEQALKRATPVLVYQMGKVGSQSVQRSLAAQYPGPVVHAHKFTLNDSDPLVRRLYRWSMVQAKRLKVISLTREPITRNISEFFHNFEKHTGIPTADAKFSLAEIKALFLSESDHDRPLEWFDKNILPNFGIDVFATPFPENGVATYAQKNVELLIMRVEISDQLKITAIQDFLGLDDFQLHNENIGEEKDYADTYSAFKRSVKFPPEYVEKMCTSKYFNHFYSKADINASRARWSEQ